MADYVRIFSNSLGRMEKAGAERGELIAAFYEQFLDRSRRAADKFANTEMERQQQMLRESFVHMLEFSTRRRSDDELERIARRHSRADLDIEPALYDEWIDSLVAAVETLDPKFDPEVAIAWRIVMAPGIEFMKGHHASG